MRTNINRTKITNNTEFCIVVGCYQLDGEYTQDYLKYVKFNSFPSIVRKQIRKGFDYTTIIYPQFNSIFVIVRKELMDKIEEDIDKDSVKALFDTESRKCNSPYDIVVASGNFSKE